MINLKEKTALIGRWGCERVENALIFITNASDRYCMAVIVQPTSEMVEGVLSQVYGDDHN